MSSTTESSGILTLTLPDGAIREVLSGTPARDVVASIGSRLLQAAIAVVVDDEVRDLGTPLRHGGRFRVLTDKNDESLAVLRHSGAHILATAVRRLRPDAMIGFGPAIDDGFYYDFQVDNPFTPEDLQAFLHIFTDVVNQTRAHADAPELSAAPRTDAVVPPD